MERECGRHPGRHRHAIAGQPGLAEAVGEPHPACRPRPGTLRASSCTFWSRRGDAGAAPWRGATRRRLAQPQREWRHAAEAAGGLPPSLFTAVSLMYLSSTARKECGRVSAGWVRLGAPAAPQPARPAWGRVGTVVGTPGHSRHRPGPRSLSRSARRGAAVGVVTPPLASDGVRLGADDTWAWVAFSARTVRALRAVAARSPRGGAGREEIIVFPSAAPGGGAASGWTVDPHPAPPHTHQTSIYYVSGNLSDMWPRHALPALGHPTPGRVAVAASGVTCTRRDRGRGGAGCDAPS